MTLDDVRSKGRAAPALEADTAHYESLTQFYHSGFVVLENGDYAESIADIQREFDDPLDQPSLLYHEYENGFYRAVGGTTIGSLSGIGKWT